MDWWEDVLNTLSDSPDANIVYRGTRVECKVYSDDLSFKRGREELGGDFKMMLDIEAYF